MKKFFPLWSCVISAAIGLLIAVGVFYLNYTSSYWEETQLLRVLSDACFIPGGVFIGVGLLSIIAGTGQFDTLSYGAHSLLVLFTSIKRPEDHENFVDYKQKKDAKRGQPKYYLLFFGVIFVLLAVVFYIIYSSTAAM